jgi:hypothetical protein
LSLLSSARSYISSRLLFHDGESDADAPAS